MDETQVQSEAEPAVAASPVSENQRIESLDVLRGFALLGILLLNIQSFGLIGAEYLNPTAVGPLNGVNYGVWWFTNVFGELKFMTLFSALFGAGIVLMWERAKAAGRGVTLLHYRRMFWLALFGLAHGHLVWEGDILFMYAMCGMLVFWLCGWGPRWLIIIGLIWMSVAGALYLMSGLSMPYWPEEQVAEFLEMWRPTQEQVSHELATMRGSWFEQLSLRSSNAFYLETFVFLIWGLWRAGGLMLIGMALFKWNVLSAERSDRFYIVGACLGLVIGLGLAAYGVMQNEAHSWSVKYSFFLGSLFNYWGSLGISFGYLCVIMLFVRRGWLRNFQNRLAAVGQMALTNYLSHSILCTTLFYGHGFGWFGHLSRTQLLIVVVSIWVLQLWLSPIWLKTFSIWTIRMAVEDFELLEMATDETPTRDCLKILRSMRKTALGIPTLTSRAR